MVSSKACFLWVVLAVCIQLYNAQFIPGARCLCEGTIKFTPETIVDFQINEKGPNCGHTEVIVTLEKDNSRRCLNTVGKLAKAFLMCWSRIDRDENQKIKCLNRVKKQPK